MKWTESTIKRNNKEKLVPQKVKQDWQIFNQSNKERKRTTKKREYYNIHQWRVSSENILKTCILVNYKIYKKWPNFLDT
jgi:hypothetical protein